LQGVCDANKEFSNVCAQQQGRIHDEVNSRSLTGTIVRDQKILQDLVLMVRGVICTTYISDSLVQFEHI